MTEQARAAAITLFAAALVQLDYATRQLQQGGTLKGPLKMQLNILHNHADKFLTASQSQFDCTDADQVNALSDVIGEASLLLLQMDKHQLIHHLQAMQATATSNLTPQAA